MRQLTLNKVSALAVIASCSLASPLWAAEENTAPDAVPEITVTAQRTNQSSQAVPLAITALSGDFFRKVED